MDTGLSFASLGVMMLPMFLISLAVIAFIIVCTWKMYVKMGEPGWAAIIPIYNQYVLFKRVWETKFFFIFLVISILSAVVPTLSSVVTLLVFKNGGPAGIIGIVFSALSFALVIGLIVLDVLLMRKLSDKFGKGVGFTVLLVLIPIVGYAILAFTDVEYEGDLLGGGSYDEKEDDYDNTMGAMDILDHTNEMRELDDNGDFVSQEYSQQDNSTRETHSENDILEEQNFNSLEEYSEPGYQPQYEEQEEQVQDEPSYDSNDYTEETFDIKQTDNTEQKSSLKFAFNKTDEDIDSMLNMDDEIVEGERNEVKKEKGMFKVNRQGKKLEDIKTIE